WSHSWASPSAPATESCATQPTSVCVRTRRRATCAGRGRARMRGLHGVALAQRGQNPHPRLGRRQPGPLHRGDLVGELRVLDHVAHPRRVLTVPKVEGPRGLVHALGQLDEADQIRGAQVETGGGAAEEERAIGWELALGVLAQVAPVLAPTPAGTEAPARRAA